MTDELQLNILSNEELDSLTGNLPFRMTNEYQDAPEFYATYKLMNEKTYALYTGKLQISVVDLTHTELATREDKERHRDLWAAFFKSRTWEELKMLAEKDDIFAETLPHIKKLTDDEYFRLKCEAREDHIRQENDMKAYYNQKIKERDEQLANKDELLASKDEQLAEQSEQLASKDEQLASKDEQLAKQGEQLANKDEQLAEQARIIAELQAKLNKK